MRILLASTASHVPPRGGSTRSNLIWLEHLAQSGHTCSVVCGTPESSTEAERERLHRELAALGIEGSAFERSELHEVEHRGIRVFAAAKGSGRAALLRSQIERDSPDWVLVSSEDLSHSMLKQAAALTPEKLIYIAHTPQFFPFGPESWNPDEVASHAIRKAGRVVVIGEFMAEYVNESLGVRPAIVHPPVYGAPPYRNLARYDAPFVTMINPCTVKGLPIFLALADALPEISFAALPGWGTTVDDRRELARRGNVTLLKPVRDIEEVFEQTRILLVPSLWLEGFGLVAMEAMLRGLPVISSDAGGLTEAKRDTGFLIRTAKIERYTEEFDERHMPVPALPEVDVAPWVAALRQLLTSGEAWEDESKRSRQRALSFVGQLEAGNLGRYLEGLASPSVEASQEESSTSRLARLSPEKRAMLLAKLRRS
jgi:glycosyltransferase involved in cell wall biosynthesis